MKFQLFKNGKLVEKFGLYGTYLFGTDGIPFRASVDIKFKKGLIECKKHSPEAAGLALLWPIDGFGRILLPTTRLPERDRPYLLSVELARAKLMQITIKREDWSVFEENNDLANIGNEARNLFIQSLQNISDPPNASSIADECLKKAAIFAEQLTTRHAELLFEARHKSRGLGRHCLGAQVNTEQIESPQYVEKLLGLFGLITIPTNWRQIEVEKGKYDFSRVDKCFDILCRKKLAICAGPCLQFVPDCLPQWLIERKPEFEKIREAAYEFVSNTISRYAKYVHSWRVLSGLNALNYFGFTFEQVLEMTRATSLAARAAAPRSLKVIEIVNPWCEYYATTPGTIPALVYADMLLQSGIPFDAFGLEMRFGRDQAGMHLKDMMDVSAMLDRFSGVNKPLHITSLGVPDKPGTGPTDGTVAGVWHRDWNQSLQAEWLELFTKIALSKPFVNTVTYSTFADEDGSEVSGMGLLTKDFEVKESFRTLTKLQKLVLSH